MSTTVTITVDGPTTGAAHGASGATPPAGQEPSMEPPGADAATFAEADDEVPSLVPQDLGADASAGDTDAPGEPPDPDVLVDDDLTLPADVGSLGPEPSIQPS
ncbi:MAG: hypothetical protein WBG89_03790 [Ornithinimicrobium sp.]